jgi:DNA-binding protein H-NS
MVRTANIDKLSYSQLLTLQERIAAAIAERKSADAIATRQQLKEMAEKAGFDINELFGKRGRKGGGAAKYRNPKNPSQTWTGRGRKPNWLVDAVKKGGKLESFAI